MAAGDAGSDEKDHHDDIASTTAPDQARSVLAKQASAPDSVWLADNMPLGREALLLFVICMAQFCTRTQSNSFPFSVGCPSKQHNNDTN